MVLPALVLVKLVFEDVSGRCGDSASRAASSSATPKRGVACGARLEAMAATDMHR
jgi:hypothetical protein